MTAEGCEVEYMALIGLNPCYNGNGHDTDLSDETVGTVTS